ncbi:MAG TPA: nuclear transport factor 2 family protein [Candidatus Limnocylindria bacterium]|nr:nuclear transport factor 2 family protein [Candidatus Limnocylindria bacterium]
MNDHPNAALVRKMSASFNSGDLQQMTEMIADDIEWHEIGRKEPIIGKEALAARFGMGSGTPPPYEITGETHDVIANDHHTVVLANAHATKKDGSTLDYKVAEIYHMKDGKITARWAVSDDTEAINNFFQGE